VLGQHITKRCKYRAYTASSGLEALQLIKDISIDLVFTDVNMPEMSGWELCRIINREYIKCSNKIYVNV